ncbi:MAG: alpha/beta hydrolase, partial [Peptococcaceae bacterium]|nr:alpha/beta hydrolase [Peptococcaceae bacterium]
MKFAAMVFLLIVLAGVLMAGRFCYQNLHWWEKDMDAIAKLGVIEQQAILPNGRCINYGELEGDGPALLLIHGQMGAWEDYASIMPELHENWHIYAIDVYGHGESSHDEALYYLDVNG